MQFGVPDGTSWWGVRWFWPLRVDWWFYVGQWLVFFVEKKTWMTEIFVANLNYKTPNLNFSCKIVVDRRIIISFWSRKLWGIVRNDSWCFGNTLARLKPNIDEPNQLKKLSRFLFRTIVAFIIYPSLSIDLSKSFLIICFPNIPFFKEIKRAHPPNAIPPQN